MPLAEAKFWQVMVQWLRQASLITVPGPSHGVWWIQPLSPTYWMQYDTIECFFLLQKSNIIPIQERTYHLAKENDYIDIYYLVTCAPCQYYLHEMWYLCFLIRDVQLWPRIVTNCPLSQWSTLPKEKNGALKKTTRIDTLPKTNIAPEDGWLEYYTFLLERPVSKGELLVSGRVHPLPMIHSAHSARWFSKTPSRPRIQNGWFYRQDKTNCVRQKKKYICIYNDILHCLSIYWSFELPPNTRSRKRREGVERAGIKLFKGIGPDTTIGSKQKALQAHTAVT